MSIEYVLGIETSCDETAAAIYSATSGLIAHQLFSQIKIHERYGGVVPELASRDHIRKTLPLIQAVLKKAGLQKKDLDAVAYTKGPGLVGALMVGASIGRSVGFALNIPTLGVHHMEAHLMAALLDEPELPYPFIALLVSGGHTQLVHVEKFGVYTLLGESVDDAVGEAFDKTAKLLGLPYPGGPELAKLAEQGDPKRFHFPRPMTNRPGLDFSFSGLKTHAIYTLKENDDDKKTHADIARAFEDAVVDTLVIKSRRALEQTGLSRLVVVGGVSANQRLRGSLREMMEQRDGQVYFPRQEFCTDNAAMVAYAGFQRLSRGERDDMSIGVKPRWLITEISAVS